MFLSFGIEQGQTMSWIYRPEIVKRFLEKQIKLACILYFQDQEETHYTLVEKWPEKVNFDELKG